MSLRTFVSISIFVSISVWLFVSISIFVSISVWLFVSIDVTIVFCLLNEAGGARSDICHH